MPAAGATLTVCPAGCDHTSIQGAVDVSQNGDVIQLQTGLPITENNIIVSGTKSVTIRGLGVQTSVVQASASEQQDAGRIFLVDLLATLVLEDMRLRHGDVDHLVGSEADGGTIYNLGRLTLRRVWVVLGFAQDGGGIYNNGELTMEDSEVLGCQAWNGAGVYNDSDAVAELRGSTLEGNWAIGSGGAFSNRGDLHIAESAMVENELDGGTSGCGGLNWGSLSLRDVEISRNCRLNLGGTPRGAALAMSDGGSAVLERVQIFDNGRPGVDTVISAIFGDTVHLLDSEVRDNDVDESAIETSRSLRIEGSTISGHQHARGIHKRLSGTLEIVRSTISDNRTDDSGGGLLVEGGTVRVASSTITGNRADADGDSSGDGGGVWVDPSATLEIRNTLIADNLDASPFILDTRADDCHGDLQSYGHNLIEALGPSNNPVPCAVTGVTAGNVIGMSPQLGEIADNGGPTQTVALLEGSPAIDGGDPVACLDVDGVTPLTADQRGAPYVGALGSNGPICDIGAFEYGSFVGLFADGFESGDTGAWTATVGAP